MRRSGSKRLFLSSEFPGSRLAAIPGTGVTFPAEPTAQGGTGGGTHSRTHTHTKSIHTHTHGHSMLHMSVTHAWTPTLTHTCVQACSQPRLHVQSLFKLINKRDVFTHTHTVLQTHTYLHVHVHVPKALPNIMYNAEKHE